MHTSPRFWSRRRFIATAGTGVAALLNSGIAFADDEIDPRVAAIVAATIGIDTHNHIDVPLKAEELPGPAVDLKGEMTKSGLSAICMTFAVDYQKLANPGEAYERFQRGLDAMDRILESNGMKRALNLADLKAAHEAHQPTVIQSVEGCHFVEGRIERVEAAYGRGLRHLGLLHDSDASPALGDVYTNKPQWGGLTDLGAQVIKECNRLGMLVDLAHASNDTINAALKIATQPVIISHTGLNTQLGSNPNMARMMSPRLISREQAKIVADAGGVIGVWTHLADTPLDHAKNVRALVDVVGIDHVCIGTDTKLTPAYRSPGGFGGQGGPPRGPEQNGNDRPKDHQDGPPGEDGKGPKDGPGGQGGPGPGGPGGPGGKGKRAGERTNEAWQDQKVGFYYAVVDALLKTGFNEDEITKIGGGNFCRVFDAATKSH